MDVCVGGGGPWGLNLFMCMCAHVLMCGCQMTAESPFSTSTMLKQGLSCFLPAGPQTSRQLSCLHFPSRDRSSGITDGMPSHLALYVGSRMELW